jgi:signal transduction histidine kinase
MIIYIEDEIKRLNKLIEDFLIFARPSEVKLRMIDLNRLSKDVVARAEYLDTNKGLRVYDEIPEEECEANADPELLTGALWNIVKNSCEATNGKGRVWVRAYQNGTFWMMEVEDDGVGVSEENKDRIFEPFFTTKAKGTGLGLTFASQVIAAHGGQIQVERSKEGGALFRIKIPRRVESASNGGRG